MVFARFVCFSDHVLFPVSCIGPFDELPWDLDISRTLYSPMYSLIWYTIAGCISNLLFGLSILLLRK